MMKMKDTGFTLIELMIVVAIIGILAAVAIPKFADLIDRAKEAKVKGNLSAIRSAISIYYGSYEGLAPSDEDGTTLGTALVTDGDNMSKLPGADIPTATVTAEWGDDAATFYLDYGSKGTDGTNVTGWTYDYDDLEIWCEVAGLDTASEAIHSW